MKRQRRRRLSPEERRLRQLEYIGQALERDVVHLDTRISRWRDKIEACRAALQVKTVTCPSCGASLSTEVA